MVHVAVSDLTAAYDSQLLSWSFTKVQVFSRCFSYSKYVLIEIFMHIRL